MQLRLRARARRGSRAAYRTSGAGSPWISINTQYYSAQVDAATGVTAPREYVGAALQLGDSVIVSDYPYGASLSDADVQAIVGDALAPGGATGLSVDDAQAIYVVLTSADVNLTSGFCTNYCGWHTNATLYGRNVRFMFVGDGSRCPRVNACAAVTDATAPNGNAAADAMASILMHELSEVLTDPDLDAWYDTEGLENADKCAWRFGPQTTDPRTGRISNVRFGSLLFLIQQNWVPAAYGGFCAMQPPAL